MTLVQKNDAAAILNCLIAARKRADETLAKRRWILARKKQAGVPGEVRS